MREATFGRRGITPRASRRERIAVPESRSEPERNLFAEPAFVPGDAYETSARELSPEEELLAWKAERSRQRFARFPWRQMALMAGLCFGIAGFVLPDSVDDALSWVLYALAAASFAAGILKRKAAAKAVTAA